MLGLGMPELVLIAGLLVLLFGGKRVGELGKGIGQGIRDFKRALREDNEDE